jgi:hypothetical protein
MEQITIVVKPAGVEVVPGRTKGAKLQYRVSGQLEIFVFGAVPVPMRDKVHYHAMEQCRNRNIPLLQLKKDGWI